MIWNDVLVILALICCVPFLVSHYLSANRFTQNFRMLALIGGFVWLILGLGGNDVIFSLLGVERMDDYWHDQQGRVVAEWLALGNWEAIGEYAITGNARFHLWVGGWYCLIGLGKTTLEAFNCFLGFWGTLALTRYFSECYPSASSVNKKLLLVTFLPSAVFWNTILIKEGLMFWSICLFFVSTMPRGNSAKFALGLWTVPAFATGLLLRPYTMVAWVCAIGAVAIYKSGRVLVSLVLVAGLVASIGFFSSQLQIESVEDARALGETNAEIHTTIATGGSTIYGPSIFFVSGAVSLFFRPFIWNVRAFRLVISAVEIWSISLLMIFGFLSINSVSRHALLSRADVQVSILVCIAFCIIYTFMVNEGQIARSRLQAMPALLTLAYIPMALKMSQKEFRMRNKRSLMMRAGAKATLKI